MRVEFFVGLFIILSLTSIASYYIPILGFLWVVIAPLTVLGLQDFFQKKSAIRRNFPLLGRLRFLFEMFRPEIQQYFIETNSEGMPFSRETRSVIYQRAKRVLDTLPFGTQKNVYQVGYEWINHSLAPVHVDVSQLRIEIGGKDCKKKYNSSILNISAMSFGSLSQNAISSLNLGAAIGGFSHNTGEGSISDHHRKGGDLVWQIGTAYFGTRTKSGGFCPEKFEKKSQDDQVKMIEIKLSQGAKPGHGGILPGGKVTEEIARVRDVPAGQDVLSPPAHSAFSTPKELIQFVQKLRELSGGKPVGFKLCLGKPREFFAICKAMKELDCTPDFITVDGSEGGTGAAPLEFSNYIGTPLQDAIVFVHNALIGFGLRDNIRIIASGKISTGFDVVKALSAGADACNAARSMMMAVGCIQALKCNSNDCPAGVATQDKAFQRGLIVSDKKQRVANYHHQTLLSFSEMIGAMGVSKHSDLRPWHVMRKTESGQSLHYGRIYDYLKEGDLLNDQCPSQYKHAVESARADSFSFVE